MDICRGTEFSLKDKSVIAMKDIHIGENEKGYFILDFWEQCEHPDITVSPVVFVKCQDEREYYVLKKDNIVLGSEKDICLT